MTKLIINAAKNYGDKIKNVLNNPQTSPMVDGVYISVGDFPNKQIIKLQDDFSRKTKLLFEFPIFYLLEENVYIAKKRMKKLVKDEKETRITNKLDYLMHNVGFSNFTDLPLTPATYVKNRNEIFKIIEGFYANFFNNSDEIIIPTFILKDLNSWKEIFIEDAFQHAQSYADKNDQKITCSFIIDFEYLEKEDVASRLTQYFSRYKRFDTVSITLTIDKVGANAYTTQQYITYMSFIRELNFNGIKVRIQNAGLKDVILSILDIESFGVGWSSSYRGLNLEQRKISDHEVSGFGKKTKKIMLAKLLSEIPLTYLSVFTAQERATLFDDGTRNLDIVTFNWLEQKYWIEFIKMVDFDGKVKHETSGIDYSMILNRIEIFEKKLEISKDLLVRISERLNQNGRYDDAKKLENDQMRCIISYINALNEFKYGIFDF